METFSIKRNKHDETKNNILSLHILQSLHDIRQYISKTPKLSTNLTLVKFLKAFNALTRVNICIFKKLY